MCDIKAYFRHGGHEGEPYSCAVGSAPVWKSARLQWKYKQAGS
jgi:hypothetical protein